MDKFWTLTTNCLQENILNCPPIPFFTLLLQLGSRTRQYQGIQECITLSLHPPHWKTTPLMPAISTVGPTPLPPYYSILVDIFHNSRKSYSSSSCSCICNQFKFPSHPFAFGYPPFQVPSHGPTDFQRPVPLPSRFTRSFKKDTSVWTTQLIGSKRVN